MGGLPLESPAGLRVAVLSNITLEPYFAPLMESHFGGGTLISRIPYGEHREPAYAQELKNAGLLVVWLNLEALAPDLLYSESESGELPAGLPELLQELYKGLRSASQAKILWFSFEDYASELPAAVGRLYAPLADRLNLALSEMLGDADALIDLKRLIAEVGISRAYDQKGKYRWNAPYSKGLMEAAVRELHAQWCVEKGLTKKCLVLDCDNVLWGGVLSEDGIENIRLGSEGRGRLYQDFQRFVLSLYRRGVILAVCSKNDEEDVLAVFRGHSGMLLREEHIACFQVNWGDKPGNIRRIAETLRIGLESMVFVDDSPAEVEAVRSMLPEVTAVLFGRDMPYEAFSCFHLKRFVSRESAAQAQKRNETYRADKNRAQLRAKYTEYAAYLEALETRVNISAADPLTYNRISELSQRTNRRTNGVRYTVPQLRERASSPEVRLYAVTVSDRFSDLGLVGAIEVEGEVLTLFSLSCRALGRDIENKMLEFLRRERPVSGFLWKPTGKNDDMQKLLAEGLPGASCIGV